MTHDDSSLTRRQVLAGAGGTGLLAAAAPVSVLGSARPVTRAASAGSAADGTPEQIHLTWGADPASSVTVSWASPGPAVRPRVLLRPGRTVPAIQRTYTDGLNGETVWTYHAEITGLAPGRTYQYAVTADNDASAPPFAASFTTAPRGRAPFRFTSFGDLATPNTQWVLSYGQSAYAVAAVESFQPLFHLLNGDLCYADLNPTVQPEVWRDFGHNNQSSAASRPWMPAPGNHEVEFDNGPQGFTSYLTRYRLPDNGVPTFRGRWYSGGAQTAWLKRTLAAARRDPSIDWIVAQMHQIACSSSATGNGSDLGIRQAWLPLFDRYQVDLVLNGHDHDYERSFPCRGFDNMAGTEVATGAAVQTMRPHPVTTEDTGVFDTSQGTVHLVLGCGGTDANLDDYGVDTADGMRQAKVFTKPNRPEPTSTAGVFARPAADAVEDAPWSARRDTSTGYGIAVFDVDPGGPGGMTSITVTHYHAVGADPVNPATGEAGAPTPDYTEFETFTLVRPRSDHPGRGAGAPQRAGTRGSG